MDAIGMALDMLDQVADNYEDSDMEDDAKEIRAISKNKASFQKALKNKKSRDIIIDAIQQGIDMHGHLTPDEEDALYALYQK